MMMIPMEDASNTMTFVSAELSSTMFQKLYEQKKANRFCDLTLHVNNKIIKAHRNVLACSSPYFDSILKHHKIIREQLIITCMDSDTFTTILNYMYTGEITIEHSNVEELLKLADHFIITKVIEYCIEFLGTKLNLDNCLFTYFLTQRFKLKHLGNIVENWIVSHIDEICDGEEIINLNANELGDFFKNKSFILSTARALNLLAEWTMHNNIKREHAFDKLIKCFDTNSLEPNQVFKHLDTHILYTKSDFCMYRFLDHLVQNNWMLSNFKARYDNLHLKYNAELIQQIENNSVKSAKIDNKIIVAEKNDSPTQQQNDFTSVLVKAKLRNKKQLILKRLMLFGLKPSLRMAALKMLTCNNKKKCLNLMEEDDEEGNADEELNDEDEEETEKKQDGVKCPICFQQINDTLLLEQHLALSHSKDVTYKCGICCYICQYHGDYLNHMKSHFTGPPYKCDYCDMNCDQIAKLISHRAQHLDEALFQCTFCSFKCRLKANFAAHLKIHTANLPLPASAQTEKLFKCDECTKSFRFKPNLESHKLSHTADESKNLTCDACGFHTKFLSHMIAHKRIHSSGEVYKCSFAHCKFSTAKKNQLAAHIKSNHHNNGSAAVRPHTCGVCGRGFMEKSHLVRHERIHLEEKPFKCSNCDYASSRRDKLKEHFTRHHGENASAKVPYKARPMRTNSSNNNRKVQQETVVATTSSNFSASSTTTSTSTSVSSQPLGNEIQDLIMHHQSAAVAAINSNYHHFGEASADFHHHHHHHGHHHHHYNHNLVHNQLLSNGQRSNVLNNNNNGGNSGGSNQISNSNGNLANHHMLSRSNHSTATSTAAAVAAAMMLDPRFHHNSTPYHGASTAAMAAVQQTSQQQVQGAAEYSTSLQNCMTLF